MEVVSLHVGGAGTRIGIEFWKQMQKEYQNKHAHSSNFYDEGPGTIIRPRAIFADTDNRIRESVIKSGISFSPKSILTSGSSCHNLFAEGLYHSGGDLVQNSVMEALRIELQKCDRPSGFILSEAASGGVGSGMGSKLINLIREQHPCLILQIFCVTPGGWEESSQQAISPLDVYNMVLMNHHLIENTDLIMYAENKAIQKILRLDGNLHPNFDQMNQYLGRCISEHTAPYRLSGPINTNQRKRCQNLMLFPRLKTLRGSLSQPHSKNSLISALDWRRQLMTGICRDDIRVYNMGVSVRDPTSYQSDIHRTVLKQFQTTNNKFAEWLPCPIHLSITNDTNEEWGRSAWTLTNASRNIQGVKSVCEMFTAQFRRKAFLYHYTTLGMDEMQFTEAQSNINDLISEYTPCHCAYDTEWDEEESQQYPE